MVAGLGQSSRGRPVVFDMDGVLSDAATRQHYLEGPLGSNRHVFFEACAARMRRWPRRRRCWVCSIRRCRSCRSPPARGGYNPQTVAWLARYGLRWDLLIMRDWGDYWAACEFKQYSVYELRQFGFDLRLAFEDDRRNRAMFHREGTSLWPSTSGTSTDRSCRGFPCVHGCVRAQFLARICLDGK